MEIFKIQHFNGFWDVSHITYTYINIHINIQTCIDMCVYIYTYIYLNTLYIEVEGGAGS
jgi:hypothetical protein